MARAESLPDPAALVAALTAAGFGHWTTAAVVDGDLTVAETVAALDDMVRTGRRAAQVLDAVQPQPRVWSPPDEPGPEVTAVWSNFGTRWVRVEGGWNTGARSERWEWGKLLYHAGPLTEIRPLSDATVPAAGGVDTPGAEPEAGQR